MISFILFYFRSQQSTIQEELQISSSKQNKRSKDNTDTLGTKYIRGDNINDSTLRRSNRISQNIAPSSSLDIIDEHHQEEPVTDDIRGYGNPVLMKPIMDDTNVPIRTLESFKWLENTYHRDFVDNIEYQTIRVYTTRFRGDDYIVVDRVRIGKNGHKIATGDTKCIHARDVEEYTIAYLKNKEEILQVVLNSDMDDFTQSLVRYLHELPPLQDPIREFILTTGLITLPDVKVPTTHKMAMKSEDALKWQIAEQAELDSMTKHKVFTQMVLPPGKKKIDTKWVYAVKYKDGQIYKYKARLVAKGYEQIYGVDYEETYAPVARLTSLRIVLAISAKLNFDIQQMDVETAFLNATLEEEVYISIPSGVTMLEGCNCIRLNKALYGLKQSPREWYDNINACLQSLSFRRLHSEHCLYIYNKDNEICIISLYVDDLIIAGSDKRVTNRVKQCLSRRYSMKDLGDIDEILGCKVHFDHHLGCVTINQCKYTAGILSKYLEPPEQTWIDTPADSTITLTTEQSPQTEVEKEYMSTIPYREVIGSLLWLSMGTRPDITYAVSQSAKFSANPGIEHWKSVKRILRYLHGTRTLGLKYQSYSESKEELSIESMIPVGYVDADYARDPVTRRSCSGYMFFLANAPISWQTRQQPTVALSTMESEFMAACAAAQESVWLMQLLTEFGTKFNHPINIYEDNKACIDYTKNSTSHQRTKHISVRYHFIRDLIQQGALCLLPIKTADNIADILTKPLDKKVFQNLRVKFMHLL